MRKTEIRVERVDAFFERGRKLARLVDRGGAIPSSVVVAFEDAEEARKPGTASSIPNSPSTETGIDTVSGFRVRIARPGCSAVRRGRRPAAPG